MSNSERLVAVAIKRGDKIESLGFRSHYDLRLALGDALPTTTSLFDIDGFMTSDGQFVTRKEAIPIAIIAGQIHESWKGTTRALLSSDISW